jgi:hypothetical protein
MKFFFRIFNSALERKNCGKIVRSFDTCAPQGMLYTVQKQEIKKLYDKNECSKRDGKKMLQELFVV